VIGESIDVIAAATLDDAWDFFYSHYSPDNLIMCVSGNIDFERAVELTEKWFGNIPCRNVKPQIITPEPIQLEPRRVKIERDVPKNMILKAYRMCGRVDDDYQTSDIVSDILANGNSARFFRNVLMQSDVFSSLDASIGGSLDPGLFYVRGYLQEGVSYEEGEAVIKAELDNFLSEGATEYEITKYVNKLVSKEMFENISYQEKATKLCAYEFQTEAGDINIEEDKYRAITPADVDRVARSIFREECCTTLFYGK
jgi:predicted Zn-dependent peptidase